MGTPMTMLCKRVYLNLFCCCTLFNY